MGFFINIYTMKIYFKITTIFILIFITNLFATNNDNSLNYTPLSPIDTTSVLINSHHIDNMLNSFIKDAIDNGMDSTEVINHIKKLDAILLLDLTGYNILGSTICKIDTLSPYGIRAIVVIKKTLIEEDMDVFKLTLYHELGHWFGLEHCGCGSDIMMGKYNKESSDGVLKYWDVNVIFLMDKIKSSYIKNRNNFDFPKIPDNKSIKVIE